MKIKIPHPLADKFHCYWCDKDVSVIRIDTPFHPKQKYPMHKDCYEEWCCVQIAERG